MPDVLAQDDVLSFTPGSPMLAPPPPAPAMVPQPAAAGGTAAPAPPNLQQQIQQDRGQSDAAIAAMQKSMAGEEATLQQRQREMEPLRQRAFKLAEQPLPQPPKQQQPSAPPKRNDQHDDENWLFASALLGSLAGALTRRHQTNALAAFSGMMEGYNEGSKQKFDQNMKIWDAENKKTLETNKQATDEYREILENRKLDMSQMSVAMQLAGQKYDDQAAIQAAKTKNSLVMAQFYDKRAEAAEKMQQASDNLIEKRDEAQRKQQTQLAVAQMRALGVQPDQEMPMIDKIGRYELAPITGPRGTAIMNLVAEKYPEYDVQTWFKKKYESTTDLAAERAGKTASARTFGAAGANIELVMSRAGPVLTNAAEAANAVPATEFKRINQLYQTAAEEISDPAIRNFKVANEEVAALFAAVLNPRSGVITVSAMDHARQLIAESDGPEAYDAILHNIQRLAERESANIRSLKAGGESAPINIPPISSERRATGPELISKTAERATGAIDQAAGPGNLARWGQQWESLHPHLPGWMVREVQ